MIINYVEFKNIKSYGNKLQRINFDTTGKLILLTGTNGAGKSTIQDSIDLSLFNQVRGKETSKIPLKNFPNRLNKELYVGINFINNNNDLIEINRKLQPSEFSILKNHELYTERFKVMSDEEREKIIGFNYNTFKSFISLSMNDFRNFIKLSNEDKRNLLNRLFNLEEIDSYYSINKELINQNKKEIEKLNLEIYNINKTIKEYSDIIKNKNIKESKKDIKEKINSYKETYNLLKEDLKTTDNNISDLLIKIQECKNIINSNENDNNQRRNTLLNYKEKIELYENGKCPYCNSNLNDEKHRNILINLKNKSNDIKEIINNNLIIINNCKTELYDLSSNLQQYEKNKKDLTKKYNDLKIILLSLKTNYDNYDDSADILINEIKQKGKSLITEKKEKELKIDFLKKEVNDLIKLKEILSENGIRKNIITSIIPPINETLVYLLGKINYPYQVILNDNFDAEIYDKGELINSETMSNGENRILSLCIAISYINMIRKINNINVLFMDEVFQSIHKENINLILDLLKTFSKENNINLIVVHQGLEEVNPKFFDKIILVEKELFSDIKITDNVEI